MRFIAILLLMLTYNVQAQLPTPSSGTIERLSNFKSEYVDARNIDIWLPNGYSSDKKYCVLYMHDGQMLFDANLTWNKQEWGVDEVLGELMAKGKIQDVIVVGIWNNGEKRSIEYMPQTPVEKLTEKEKGKIQAHTENEGKLAVFKNGPLSDKYLMFIVRELKPYIEENYSVYTDAAHNFTAGSSMGGLISMYAYCEYPLQFGGAACLSTHWIGTYTAKNNPLPNKFFEYLEEYLPDPNGKKIYFDYGTATLDAFYEPFQKKADNVLLKRGYNSSTWVTHKFPGADHSEKAWNARLHIPMLFLLGK